jgi:hypothetical protein
MARTYSQETLHVKQNVQDRLRGLREPSTYLT